MRIGSLVRLKIPCLNSKIDDIGIVFHIYDADNSEDKVYMIIFENGNYDGFYVRDAKEFTRYIGQSDIIDGYTFTSAIKLNMDYEAGVFAYDLLKAEVITLERTHPLVDPILNI